MFHILLKVSTKRKVSKLDTSTSRHGQVCWNILSIGNKIDLKLLRFVRIPMPNAQMKVLTPSALTKN